MLQSASKINEGKILHLKIITLFNINIFFILIFFQKYEQNKQKHISNPERPIGHNRLAQMASEFAARCQFQKPKQHKAHRERALGIMMLSNSSVSEQMKLNASGHSNLKSHASYQRINDENIKKKYEAMNPLLLDDSSKHAKDTNQSHPTTPSP